jgi:hypothetical protein
MAAHIFENSPTIIEHYPFLKTITFERLKPSVKFVERRYSQRLMDATTWGTLLDELDQLERSSAVWKELIDRARDAFAYLTALHYIPHGNVSIGEMGLQVEITDSHAPASKDRKNDLMRGIWEQAQDHLDMVIEQLNANLDTFTDYAASEQYKTNTKSLINEAADFNDFYPIGSNRWIWRMMMPWRDKAEQSRIIGTIGSDYHAELITKTKAETLLAEDTAIVQKAKQALAFATIEMSAMNMSIRIEEHSVSIYNNASQAENDLRTTAEISRVEIVQKHCRSEVRRLLREIENTLRAEASATKYATFFNSEAYTAPADITQLNDPTDKDHNPGTFNAL